STMEAQRFNWFYEIPAHAGGLSFETQFENNSKGEILIVGEFRGKQDFDLNIGKYFLEGQTGSKNIFVNNYSINGDLNWATHFESKNYSFSLLSYTLGDDGSAYLQGYFKDSLWIHSKDSTYRYNYPGRADFLSRLGATGKVEWINIQKQDSGSIGVYDMAVDGSRLILCGTINDIVKLDNMDPLSRVHALGGANTFIACYDTLGLFKWVKSIGGDTATDVSRAYRMTINNKTEILVTGWFEGKMDFDPSANKKELSAIAEDMFIAQYDSVGNFMWNYNIFCSRVGRILEVDVDEQDNVFFTGYFRGDSISFLKGNSQNKISSTSNSTALFGKLSKEGRLSFMNSLKYLDTSRNGWLRGVEISAQKDGQFYLGGNYNHVVNFNPIGNLVLDTAGTYGSGYIAKYDSSGMLIWVESFENYIEVNEVFINSDSTISIVGATNGVQVDVDPGEGVQRLNKNGAIYWVNWGDVSPLLLDTAFSVEFQAKYEDKIRIFPNPSLGQINIDVGDLEVIDINLYSANGRLLLRQNVMNTQVCIELDIEFSPGEYFLEIKSKTDSYWKKLIIR
ncbi:MAG: T9SS type A sorting domain-containing protein, partial [Flavobacteriales bacterium]|nr:T9SS type A sorting domain-containing protein [Flavobacteriales bacterium]